METKANRVYKLTAILCGLYVILSFIHKVAATLINIFTSYFGFNLGLIFRQSIGFADYVLPLLLIGYVLYFRKKEFGRFVLFAAYLCAALYELYTVGNLFSNLMDTLNHPYHVARYLFGIFSGTGNLLFALFTVAVYVFLGISCINNFKWLKPARATVLMLVFFAVVLALINGIGNVNSIIHEVLSYRFASGSNHGIIASTVFSLLMKIPYLLLPAAQLIFWFKAVKAPKKAPVPVEPAEPANPAASPHTSFTPENNNDTYTEH